LLTAQIGLSGLFALTGLMALTGIAVVTWVVPPELVKAVNRPRGSLKLVLQEPALLRLNLGVFVLHAVQLAMWVAIPALLVQAGLASSAHWQIYLPAVLASFVVLGVTLFPLERRGYLRGLFLTSIGLILLVQLGFAWSAHQVELGTPSLTALAWLLFVFFCGFNVLESCQPSLASRAAPAHARGAALGVYNTLQSLGFFVGGAAGGWLAKTAGPSALFMACGALMLVWLLLAWPMRAPSRLNPAADSQTPTPASSAS
jgi:predicted MFS family arabinose efflux permease